MGKTGQKVPPGCWNLRREMCDATGSRDLGIREIKG